jgi:hypothetical protein
MLAILTMGGVYKLIGILLLSPLWVPVARALWRDAEDALREEGGVFGRPPTARELARLEERFGKYETPLVNVLREDAAVARERRLR